MLKENQIRNMMYGAVTDCVTIGKAYMRIDSYNELPVERNLKELYSWTMVDTLCKVLEMDSCEMWNEIVKQCPNLGEITECSELS